MSYSRRLAAIGTALRSTKAKAVVHYCNPEDRGGTDSCVSCSHNRDENTFCVKRVMNWRMNSNRGVFVNQKV